MASSRGRDVAWEAYNKWRQANPSEQSKSENDEARLAWNGGLRRGFFAGFEAGQKPIQPSKTEQRNREWVKRNRKRPVVFDRRYSPGTDHYEAEVQEAINVAGE